MSCSKDRSCVAKVVGILFIIDFFFLLILIF